MIDVKEVAVGAGKIILEVYNEDFDVKIKKDQSPLTKADIKANTYIVERLTKYPVLTEENPDNLERLQSNYCWIVDPLDGTKEFISKNGEFTVNIALVYKNRPILGVIYLPVKDELYYAEKGKGAYFNGKKIKVSDRKKLSEMILVKSRSHATEKIQKIQDRFAKTIAAGSSLKGCMVARGDADVYFRFGPTHEWDICAMDLIVHEAGGKMTDLNGNTMKYNQRKTLKNGFVLSNTRNSKLREMIK